MGEAVNHITIFEIQTKTYMHKDKPRGKPVCDLAHIECLE
jgi:hypothetical protein